jgi:hypothetical protein
VALLLEWGLVQGNDKLLFGEKLKSALIQGAVRDENSVYPNRINGYGRLCFKNTINILKGVQTFAVKPTSTDENYADVAFDYSGALENIFKDNNVEFCKICSAYLLAFIPKKVYDSIISDESFGSGVRAGIPLLLAPMAVDENTENALDESGITDVHNILGLRGSGILIGIIDDGIDMLNEEFIFDDGTSKIIFIWNQTEADNDNCYGKVYTAEEINSALKNGVQLAPSTDGHGTKLAVVSAGKNGSAPDCEIIVVKLKQAKQYLKDRLFIGNKTAYQNTDVMTALDFITQKAYELVKPVSILIGLGTNEGGHNGYSIFEKCLSTVAVKNGICITVPTGNEATSGHHCSFDLNGKNSYYDIELNVNKNSNGTVIWLWNSLLSRISISVISPVDETIERIQPSTSFIRSYKLNLTNSTVEINYNLPLYKTSEQLTQIRISNLTQGVWKIRVFADTDNSVQILGWLPVSPFTDDGVYFLSPDTKTTLTVPSTATDIIAVGGWNSNDGSNYTKSGRGPTANGLLRPDITAPVLNGGTSFSAAFVAGSAALLLEWGIVRKNNINMNTTTISAYIANGAKKQNGSIYPNNIEGYGRLDLYNTFKNL